MEVGAGTAGDTVSRGDVITGAIIILVGGCMQGTPLSHLSPMTSSFPPRPHSIYCRQLEPI